MEASPDFTGRDPLLERAYRSAYRAHHGPERRGSTNIDHPVAVAKLLSEAGFGDDVVAAALLHDVVEDTTRGLDGIEDEFGIEVRLLVDAMTEDDSIEDYAERKAEHRSRVLSAGPTPAAIYAADKVARVQRMLETGEVPAAHRLQHYRDTLELFARLRPELPFLEQLARDLPLLEQRAAESGRDPAVS